MQQRLPLLLAFCAGVALTALLLRGDLRSWLQPATAQATAALYAARDWRQGEPSSLNISLFTFADYNRNGRYDLGDRPLAGIAARLLRSDGSVRFVRSNVNGYANFSMQLGGDADINTAGASYRFDALPPPGWTLTTANGRQTTTFREIPGSITGLGADNPPAVVGLAPPLTLSGAWPAHAGTTLSAESPDGAVTRAIPLDTDGVFSVALAAGSWRIVGGSGERREVRLAYTPVVLAPPTAGDAAPQHAGPLQDVIVDFDDNTRSFIEKLPGGYAGLDWDYLLAVDNQYYKGPGYVNGNVSGALVAYNSSGHPVTIRAEQPGARFDFVGGYFAAAWDNAEGETLHLRAWRDDDLAAETALTLSHLAPVYLQADFTAITRLEISTEHYWQFVADDLHFRVAATPP